MQSVVVRYREQVFCSVSHSIFRLETEEEASLLWRHRMRSMSVRLSLSLCFVLPKALIL